MTGYTGDQEKFFLQKFKHFIGSGGLVFDAMVTMSKKDSCLLLLFYFLIIYSHAKHPHISLLRLFLPALSYSLTGTPPPTSHVAASVSSTCDCLPFNVRLGITPNFTLVIIFEAAEFSTTHFIPFLTSILHGCTILLCLIKLLKCYFCLYLWFVSYCLLMKVSHHNILFSATVILSG